MSTLRCSVVLAAVGLVASSATSFMTPDYVEKFHVKMWKDFKGGMGLEYAGEGTHMSEDHQRMLIFKENLQRVEKLSGENPGSMFGFTRFTPLTDEEFAKDRFHGSFADTTPLPRLATSEDLNRYTTDATTRKYAGELDRRRDLAASHVKHNGECAVSGLFAAVGAIEGALAGPNRADGPAMLHPLSEQWTLSCAHTHTSCTCTDSTKCSPASVLKGILQAGAILPSEESYGYETPPSNLPCKPEEETRQRAKLLEVLALPLDTDFLKRWINFRGPFAASFTGLDQWKMYQEGTMRSSCNAEQANGEASGLVVGYGSDPNGPYWVVKMSWGSSWGMHGTIRLDMNGNCLLNPTAATVDPVKPASEPVFDPIPEEEDL